MPINTALITAAGNGDRFRPITKTIQKELLPILNRPTIDYIIQDCLRAGIKKIIIVINDNKQSLIRDYYHQEEFIFIVQRQDDQFGTATPVLLAEQYLQKENSFLVLMGDDFTYNSQVEENDIKGMIDAYQNHQYMLKGLITCITKPKEELYNYGVAVVNQKENSSYLVDLIEKPKPENAPSNLVNISKYVLTPEIFPIIRQQAPNPKNGELYLTDSVAQLSKIHQNSILVYSPNGIYLDAGTPIGWLKANLTIALDKPEWRDDILTHLNQLLELSKKQA